MSKDILSRLLRNSIVDEATGCREWQLSKFDSGYGQIGAAGKNWRAHVLMYVLANGPLLPGEQVLHTCDNRGCIALAHLKPGTHQDNMDDMVRKGRAAKGANNGAQKYPERLARGERNGQHTHPEKRATGDRHGSKTCPDSILRGDNHPSHLHPENLPHGDDHWTHKNPEKLVRGEKHSNAKLTDSEVIELRQRHAAGGITCTQLAAEYGVSKVLISFIVRRKSRKHLL